MVRQEEKFVGVENLVDHEVYCDVVLARAEGALFDNELFEFKRLAEGRADVDMDYYHFLLSILTVEELGPVKKREYFDIVVGNDSDCYIDEEIDPHYELFFKKLKEHEKSYVFEFEMDGLPGLIKYEGESSLDECDTLPRRKLRSAIKRDYGLSIHMPGAENQLKHSMPSASVEMNKKLTRRKSRSGVKNQKIEAGKQSPSDIVPDLEYLTFLQSTKLVDDYFVYNYGGATIVYERNDMEHSQEEENSDDEHSSDVEILDVLVHDEGNWKPSVLTRNGPTVQSRFREELVAVLRKPYSKEELDNLLREIKIRKPEYRHRDLRRGRERSCKTAKVGKSYIDRYPGLQKQLLKFQDDRPKFLNLLRGFFFWLQKLLQEGSFEPWNDAECLAMRPEVCHPRLSLKRERKN